MPDEALQVVVAATLRLVAEVLAGTRPARQLTRRATPQVCEELAAFAVPPGGPVRPPRVLTSWVQEPAPGTAEAGAVIALAGRVQALALRLEHHRGRWRCTVLETTAPHRRAVAV
ncbi:Rv3235 family protein [Thermomonospora echinospora]|uniref:Rv3235 family protein n=1 Tax=Thermomonospora echinospora TaxID=1992 RepID=UPI000CDECC9B|nr:Rv3235 family protein [Thermomonospora echinospora]